MTIEEAMEWCVVHHATVEFTTLYTIDRGVQEVVMLTPAHCQGIKYTGTSDFEGVISCVQKAQRAIWNNWKYQRDFTRALLVMPDGAAVDDAETQNVQ